MGTLFNDLMQGLEEVDAFLASKTAGYKVSLPTNVDVKSIRKRLNMTQARFSDTFGFSLDAVKHWEGGRRTPEASARAFLTVIAKNPAAVMSALHPSAVTHKTRGIAGRKLTPRSKAKTYPTNSTTKKTEAKPANASR